jgi:hypothetical protein
MPAQSAAQRRWAFGVKGPAWAKEHHFDTPGKLPEKVKHQHGSSNVGLEMFKKMQNRNGKHSRA